MKTLGLQERLLVLDVCCNLPPQISHSRGKEEKFFEDF